GKAVAQTNVRGGWTKDVWHLDWDGVGYCVPGLAESQVVLVDTPGLNEVDGAARAAMSAEAASRSDLVLFVTDSDLNEIEYTALAQLAASQKPLLVVLNKMDLYTTQQKKELLAHLAGSQLTGLVDPRNIVPVAADPKEIEYVIETATGATITEWRKPQPNIVALQERILEILDAEGKALVALNAAMYAADKSDRMGALRVRLREDKAAMTIWSYASMKAVAVAINPIAVADILGGTAVDTAMVATLARIYGIHITTANARSLVLSILKAAGWIMLAEAATHVASGIFKGLTLGSSAVLTALPQGAAAGYGSYIVGQAARYYFQHGASWGDIAPKQVVSQILENTDKQSILLQLKEEIRKKIRLNPYAGS
ncbi:MAG: DUF697 domain-containing protein, partial [Pirellulales bacterium]|nr:DUF697 domain-containing protein [Pirellulales bacterium]